MSRESDDSFCCIFIGHLATLLSNVTVASRCISEGHSCEETPNRKVML